jgi:hypothetical protein
MVSRELHLHRGPHELSGRFACSVNAIQVAWLHTWEVTLASLTEMVVPKWNTKLKVSTRVNNLPIIAYFNLILDLIWGQLLHLNLFPDIHFLKPNVLLNSI